ncbi:MAG: uracil-DNA glycosylase [Dehalococcoidia bacterium]|nr:uracil-DNA glycosylase [Dehalococcoidia bacterium]
MTLLDETPGGASMQSLEQIALLVRNCSDCPLSVGRTNSVPGEGNPKAKVMFIGEGPGYYEDQHGRPFVGRTGKLLDRLLASIDLIREDVFIANMVKCRPPSNRDPATTEIAACTKYLDRQIELINPKLIVTLGRFAFARYFPGEGITKASGQVREKDGRLIFPVLHPAAVLRREELRPTMIEDFKAISAILEGAMKDIGTEPGDDSPEATETSQLSFVDAQGHLDVGSANAEISTATAEVISQEEESQPEQLALF